MRQDQLPSPDPLDAIDPITFQVLKNAFASVVDEMAALIQNCAFSLVVSDGRDYSGTITTATGDLVASGAPISRHISARSHSR